MSHIKAVLFDMDGVLIDAKEWHYEALNRALGLFGYSISRYEHLVSYDGLPTRKKLELLSMEHGLPVSLHGFINELKQKYTMEIVIRQCKPAFQHEYALSTLKSKGYRLGVTSNSIRSTVETMMKRSNLLQYLDVLLGNEDVPEPKPAPDIYLKAASLLGLGPQECLILEDNEHGIRSARAAGCEVMVVKSPADVHLDNISRHLRGIGSPLR